MSLPVNTLSAYQQIGGEPAVRALVDRFYDLMDLSPALAGRSESTRLNSSHG